MSRIYLKKPSFEELKYVQYLWSDEATMKEVGGIHELKECDFNSFFERNVISKDNKNAYFLIYESISNKPVGEASFHGFDGESACFNIKVEALYRGLGYSTPAITELLKIFFFDYNGAVMTDDIGIDNKKAQNIFLDYGFKHYKTDCNAFYVKITKSDFENIPNR